MSIKKDYVVLRKYWAFVVTIVCVISLGIGIAYVGNMIKGYNERMDTQLIQHQETNRSLIFELRSGISQNDKRRWEILNTKKFILEVNDTVNQVAAENYAEWIVDEADKYANVNYITIAAIVAQESRFRDMSTSVVGARGLMQVMPETAEDMCQYLRISFDPESLYDPKTNIQIGTYYFHRLKTKYGSNNVALAGYNGGYWQARRWKLLIQSKAGIKLDEDSMLQINKIPEETMNYVPGVSKWKKKFEELKVSSTNSKLDPLTTE